MAHWLSTPFSDLSAEGFRGVTVALVFITMHSHAWSGLHRMTLWSAVQYATCHYTCRYLHAAIWQAQDFPGFYVIWGILQLAKYLKSVKNLTFIDEFVVFAWHAISGNFRSVQSCDRFDFQFSALITLGLHYGQSHQDWLILLLRCLRQYGSCSKFVLICLVLELIPKLFKLFRNQPKPLAPKLVSDFFWHYFTISMKWIKIS